MTTPCKDDIIGFALEMGEFPSGQRGQTVNLLLFSFGGSNPPSPTNKKTTFVYQTNVVFFELSVPCGT